MPTYLKSPGAQWAGFYGPNAIITTSGQPITGITPTFNQTIDGFTVGPSWTTFYTDYTKSTPAGAPQTDTYGNLSFYTEPGMYLMTFTLPGSSPTTIAITVQPFYPDAVWNVVTDSSSPISPLSGDARLVSAATGVVTETLPAPSNGARVRITKTDSSSNAVVVVTPSGLILGPNLGAYAQQTTIKLIGEGASHEFISDGTNYHMASSATRKVGIVEMYGGVTAPAGAFLCQGQAISRTIYNDLWAILGSQFGAGDGSTTFNVPNLQGRSPIGAGTGAGLTPRSAGTYYPVASGAQTAEGVYLNAAHIPGLTGTAAAQVDSGHSHLLYVDPASSGSTSFQLLYTVPTAGTSFLTGATQGVGYLNFTHNAGAVIKSGTANMNPSTVTVPVLGGTQWLTPTVTPSMGINFIIWAQ